MSDPVAPTPPAAPDLNERVSSLVESLERGTQAMTHAAERLATPAAPTPGAPASLTPEQFRAQFNEIATDTARGPAAAMEFYNQAVALPLAGAIVSQASSHAARLQRSLAEKDAELGPLMKRYKKEVAEVAKARGDGYLAENGYDSIVREIAGADPKFQAENRKAIEDAAVATARTEWEKQHPTPGSPAPYQEGVHTAPITSPSAPSTSAAADLAAIEVTPEELSVGAEVFGIGKQDIQLQKKEIKEWKARLGGPAGIKRAGGIPICSYADIGLPEPTSAGGR